MNERNLAIGAVLALGIASAATGSDEDDPHTTAEQTNSQQTASQPTSDGIEQMVKESSTSAVERKRKSLIGSTRQIPNGGLVRILDAERPKRSDVSPWRLKLRTIEEVNSGVSDAWTNDPGDTYWTQVRKQ